MLRAATEGNASVDGLLDAADGSVPRTRSAERTSSAPHWSTRSRWVHRRPPGSRSSCRCRTTHATQEKRDQPRYEVGPELITLTGVMWGAADPQLAELRDFAELRQYVNINLSQLRRMDFSCATRVRQSAQRAARRRQDRAPASSEQPGRRVPGDPLAQPRNHRRSGRYAD